MMGVDQFTFLHISGMHYNPDENRLILYLCLKEETFLPSLMFVSIQFHGIKLLHSFR